MRPFLSKLTVGALLLLALWLAHTEYTQPVGAHGSLSSPASRSYGCYADHPQAPKSLACQWALQISGSNAFYNWYSILQLPDGDHQAFVPDGQLCSGGNPEFAGFDLARDDWPATIIEDGTSSMNMAFWAWAPHATDYMDFYLTKDGYDPLEPLKWSDLEDTPFCRITDPVLDGNAHYNMACDLPDDKSGRHVIYNVWQRSDSAEAFYGCSDVFFVDENNPAPEIVTPVEGQCNANPWFSGVTYFAGDFIVHNGAEWKAQWWTLGDEPGVASVWVNIGSCDGTQPTPEPATPTPPTATATPAPVTPTPTPEPPSTPEPPEPTDGALLELPEKTVTIGTQVSVALTASDLEALASATIHIGYDPLVLSPVSCSADASDVFDFALCNVQPNDYLVSTSLISTQGVSGNHALLEIVFEAVGHNFDVSLLTIDVETFADASGVAQPFTADDGLITIANTLGDVNCDGYGDATDALFILQYTVGTRDGGTSCPPTDGVLYLPACDVDSSNSCDVVDGLFILQCAVGIENALCNTSPDRNAAMSRFIDASQLQLALSMGVGTLAADVSAEIPTSTPLGAGTFELGYDPALVRVTGCALADGLLGICNADYATNKVVLSIIAPSGLSGNADLATIHFVPRGSGDASFTLAAPIFNDRLGAGVPTTAVTATENVSTVPTAVQLDGSVAQRTTLSLTLLGAIAVASSAFLIITRRRKRDAAQ